MATVGGGSVVWNFFTKSRNSQEKTASCNLCRNIFSYKSTITNLKGHLKKKHVGAYASISQENSSSSLTSKSGSSSSRSDNYSGRVTSDVVDDPNPISIEVGSMEVDCHPSLNNIQPSSSSNANNSCVQLSRPGPYQQIMRKKQTCLSGFVEKKIKPKQKKNMDRDLLDLFILDFQPFRLVEDVGFTKFCKKWIPGYKLPSRKTISSVLIPSLYYQCLNHTRQVVNEEAESICITCDSWTSKANDSYMALTGHYISKDFEFKSVLLACSQLPGSHTAINISSEIQRIICDWGLIGKVNFAVSDNASNMVAAFTKLMNLKHYGCYAHNLNLIVQDSLDLEGVREALDKIKSIVNHFRRSSVSNEKLLRYQTNNGVNVPLTLIQDVPTRWNSTFYMLQRFVKLEEAVRATVAVLDKNFPDITVEDWRFYKDAIQILKPFEEMTRKMSGEKYCTGSAVIVVTRTLRLTCEKLSQLELGALAKRVLEHLKDGLEQRFRGVECSTTFALCTLLDPRYKDRVFKDSYALDKAKNCLKSAAVSIMEESTKNQHQATAISEQMGQEQQESSSEGVSALQILKELVGDLGPSIGTPYSRAIKEVDSYLTDDFLPSVDDKNQPTNPLLWWKSNQGRYPNLASVVRKRCNILATSVPCERIFSKSGHLISDRRTRLTTEKVEMVMFLNGNYDLYQSLDLDINDNTG